MSKTFNLYEHTFVSFKLPARVVEDDDGMMTNHAWKRWVKDAWNGPMQIVLHTGKYVWIAAFYSHESTAYPEIKRVGDCRDAGYDQDGNCVLSIPVEWVDEYYTNEEADEIAAAMCADAELLSYAR
jgi:hypothetical protein